jgi:hypothetical protein
MRMGLKRYFYITYMTVRTIIRHSYRLQAVCLKLMDDSPQICGLGNVI